MARQPRVPPTRAKPKPKPKPLRVSQIGITLMLLDEHDAPRSTDPFVFAGDDNGTATENAIAFLTAQLPAMLAAPVETGPEVTP